ARLSADGKLALSGGGELGGGKDYSMRLWDAETGKQLQQFTGHSERVICVDYLPGNKRVVSGGGDRTARLWDSETGKELRRFEGHQERVRALAVSPDGRRLLTGSFDHTLRLWDLDTGKELTVLKGHTDMVMAVAWGGVREQGPHPAAVGAAAPGGPGRAGAVMPPAARRGADTGSGDPSAPPARGASEAARAGASGW